MLFSHFSFSTAYDLIECPLTTCFLMEYAKTFKLSVLICQTFVTSGGTLTFFSAFLNFSCSLLSLPCVLLLGLATKRPLLDFFAFSCRRFAFLFIFAIVFYRVYSIEPGPHALKQSFWPAQTSAQCGCLPLDLPSLRHEPSPGIILPPFILLRYQAAWSGVYDCIVTTFFSVTVSYYDFDLMGSGLSIWEAFIALRFFTFLCSL